MLSRLESTNTGKPISGARGEIGMVAQVFHFYAGAVDKHYGETIPVGGGIDVTFREPLGVVGLITPWNFPLNIASWKVGPALATGNTIVIKPAELTPLTTVRLGALALEAGIPEGVLNVVVGKGSVVGQRLVDHPDVAKIGFTGSDRGRTTRDARCRCNDQAASRSSSAASPPTSSSPTPTSRRQQRQRRTPCSTTRARTAARARGSSSSARRTTDPRTARRGDARRQGRRSGRRRDRDGPADLCRAPRRRRLVRRGRPLLPRRGTDGPGFWFPCTLVEASNDDRVAREEVFGPVAAVIPFTDEADAIRDRESTRGTASRARSGRATAPARSASRAASTPVSCRSTRTARCESTLPSAG